MPVVAAPDAESWDHDRGKGRVVHDRIVGIGVGTIPVERGKEIGGLIPLEVSYPLRCLRVIAAPVPEELVVVVLQVMHGPGELEKVDVPRLLALVERWLLVGFWMAHRQRSE